MSNVSVETNEIEHVLLKLRLDNVDDNITSKEQTKNWRKNQSWYKGGKKNECEIFQRTNLEKLFGKLITKTNFRLNYELNDIIEKAYPLKEVNGYEYTENFDGILMNEGKTLLFNLKFVCGEGGVQTRTLREVYHFIQAQLKYLLCKGESKFYFINILEGDVCYKNQIKFRYLCNKKEYKDICDRVFVGDFLEFKQWVNLI